jgi:hypothetical protein
METDIHHPTDNTLLWDVVRVLTRLLGRLAKALELRRTAGFRNRRIAAINPHRSRRAGYGSPSRRLSSASRAPWLAMGRQVFAPPRNVPQHAERRHQRAGAPAIAVERSKSFCGA